MTVRVLLGEELNTDGSVRSTLRAQTTYDERWTLRAGTQTIEHWGYRAFRWAELVTSAELDLAGAVTLLEHVAPEPSQVGSFTSSNTDLNRVWDLCAYTIHAHRQDLFMDTPTRERGAYEGDLLTHARGQMALSPSYDLGQTHDRLPGSRPQWPTEYRFMAIAAAWEEYLETGDPGRLDADFDAARRAACRRPGLDQRGWAGGEESRRQFADQWRHRRLADQPAGRLCFHHRQHRGQRLAVPGIPMPSAGGGGHRSNGRGHQLRRAG